MFGMVPVSCVHSVVLVQMLLCSKFEDSILVGYLGTEPDATAEPNFSMFNDPRNIGKGPICITAFSYIPKCSCCSKFADSTLYIT